MRMTDSVTKEDQQEEELTQSELGSPDTRKQQAIGEPQQTLKIRNMKGGRKRGGRSCNAVNQTVSKLKS